MKRILVLLFLISSGLALSAQTLTPVNSYGFQWQRGKFVVWIQLPEDTASTAPVNSIAGIDGQLYFRDLVRWNPISSGGGSFGMDTLVVRNDSLIGSKFNNEFFVSKYDTSKWTYDVSGNYIPKAGFSDTVLLDGKNLVIRSAKLRIPDAVESDEAVTLAQLQGAIIPARDAENGLSVESDKYVLGQAADATSGAGQLTSNRYIPMNGNSLRLYDASGSYTNFNGGSQLIRQRSTTGAAATLADLALVKTTPGAFPDFGGTAIRLGIQSADKTVPHELASIRGEKVGTDSTGVFAVYLRSGGFTAPAMRVYPGLPAAERGSSLVVGDNLTYASPIFDGTGAHSIQIARNNAVASINMATSSSTSSVHSGWYTTTRSRGSFNTPTAVALGDRLGGFRAYGWSPMGAPPTASAYISAVVDQTVTGGQSAPYASLDFATGGNGTNDVRMRIGSNGAVGIGVTSPTSGYSLDISGAIKARNLGSAAGVNLVLDGNNDIKISPTRSKTFFQVMSTTATGGLSIANVQSFFTIDTTVDSKYITFTVSFTITACAASEYLELGFVTGEFGTPNPVLGAESVGVSFSRVKQAADTDTQVAVDWSSSSLVIGFQGDNPDFMTGQRVTVSGKLNVSSFTP